MDREVPPALGRALRRARHGYRGIEAEGKPMNNRTTVERKSERELVVTRTFNAPARLVFEAWAKPELFRQWWVPKSMGMSLLACEMDVCVGAKYRLVFGAGGAKVMEVFGKYIEV